MSSALERWRESFEKQRQSAIERGDWYDFAAVHSSVYWGSQDEEMARLNLEIPEKELGDVVKLGDNAFRTGKYIFAREAYSAAGTTDAVFAKLVAQVNEYLDASALDQAATSLVACGWLLSPTRYYQETGPKLHDHCDVHGCFVQGPSPRTPFPATGSSACASEKSWAPPSLV